MFKDRFDAANQLASKLEKYRSSNAIVVAIPRGGVPIGYTVASALELPLELVLSKKIGHPYNKEYAIGAVTLYGYTLDEASKDVPKEYLDSEILAIRALLMQRKVHYYGNRMPISLKYKEVILVDDGIATGSTLISCIKMIQQQEPSKIVVALPVAPYDSLQRIKAQLEIDEVVCLIEARNFYAVGQFYEDFGQVKDEEVIELLEKSYKNLLNSN